MTYTLVHDSYTGVVTGALRSDGVFVPNDPSNKDWQAFLAWNSTQTPPLSLDPIAPTARRPRVLYAIYQDVTALPGMQKTKIGNDLFGGSPPKVSTDTGPNAPSLLIIWTLRQLASLSATDQHLVETDAISIYVLDNPNYLVHPSFDPTINVPGDEPVL